MNLFQLTFTTLIIFSVIILIRLFTMSLQAANQVRVRLAIAAIILALPSLPAFAVTHDPLLGYMCIALFLLNTISILVAYVAASERIKLSANPIKQPEKKSQIIIAASLLENEARNNTEKIRIPVMNRSLLRPDYGVAHNKKHSTTAIQEKELAEV